MAHNDQRQVALLSQLLAEEPYSRPPRQKFSVDLAARRHAHAEIGRAAGGHVDVARLDGSEDIAHESWR